MIGSNKIMSKIVKFNQPSHAFLQTSKDQECDDDMCSIAGPPMTSPPPSVKKPLSRSQNDDTDQVCIVSANAKTKFKKKVYAVSVDSSGNTSQKILESSKEVYCRYKAPNVYSSSSWTPFFNEMLVAEDSSTTFDHGQVKIKVIRLGSEPCVFYPFGEEKTSIDMPSNISLIIREDGMASGQQAKTVKTIGTVKNRDGIYTVSFDESEVENLSSPMIISSEIDR